MESHTRSARPLLAGRGCTSARRLRQVPGGVRAPGSHVTWTHHALLSGQDPSDPSTLQCCLRQKALHKAECGVQLTAETQSQRRAGEATLSRVFLALRKQRGADACKFEASVIYRVKTLSQKLKINTNKIKISDKVYGGNLIRGKMSLQRKKHLLQEDLSLGPSTHGLGLQLQGILPGLCSRTLPHTHTYN